MGYMEGALNSGAAVAQRIAVRDGGFATIVRPPVAGRYRLSVSGGGIDEPLVGDVVVLATPYDGALEVARAPTDDLAGRGGVDISNPVDWASFDRLVTPADSSAAEEVAGQLADAQVVKAFNTTFAGTLSDGQVGGQQLDAFLAELSQSLGQEIQDFSRSLSETDDFADRVHMNPQGARKFTQQLLDRGILQ